MIPAVEEGLTKKASREWLIAELRFQLIWGLIDPVIVVGWAYRGSDLADTALRQACRALLERDETPCLTLRAYAAKSLESGPVKRSRGRFWDEHWLRDIALATLVHMIAEMSGLPRTRNDDQRDRGIPSASSILADAFALRRKGHRHRPSIKENTIERASGRHNNDKFAAEFRARGLFANEQGF